MWVLLAPKSMHRHVPSRWPLLKQGPFPGASCVVLRVTGTMTPSDFSPGVVVDFVKWTYTTSYAACDPRPDEISPVSLTTVPAFHSPYAGEFFEAAFPDSSPLPWPSKCTNFSALPCSPEGANMTTLQDSLHGTDCRFAPLFRVTPLHHRRSPQAVGACYAALWRLPRPDFHRQAIRHTGSRSRSLQDTPCGC